MDDRVAMLDQLIEVWGKRAQRDAAAVEVLGRLLDRRAALEAERNRPVLTSGRRRTRREW